jgi:gliding motility-associated-like protein
MEDTTCTPEVPITSLCTNQVAEEWGFYGLGNSTPLAVTFSYPASFAFPGPGLYEVVVMTNPGGACPDEARDTILVASFTPAEFLSLPVARCSRDFRFFSLAPDTVPVIWAFGDGGTSSIPQPTHTYPSNGTYYVTFVTNPQDICPDTALRPVVVGPEYSAHYTLPDSVCGTRVTPTNVTETAASYQWNWGDGSPLDTLRVPQHEFPSPGTYVVTLTVDPGTDCESTISRSLEVLPAPIADFSIAQWDCNGVLSLSNTSQGAAEFLWRFSDGSTSSQAEPVKLFATAGIVRITLEAQHPNGCRDTATMALTYDPNSPGPIQVPNVFTPNNDNLNEHFSLFGTNYACVEEVNIFDRWGVLIFHSTDPDFKWTGTNQNNGQLVPEGVYVYVLHLRNGTQRAGTVTVIR